MIPIIGIGGEPATGKSTLVCKIAGRLGPGKPEKYGLVEGTWYTDRGLFIAGKYDGKAFGGTDRLSMAVQPVMLDFARRSVGFAILFEGDRLFNGSFIEAVRAESPKSSFFILTASEEEKRRRHAARGDDQTDKFLSGRATKYENLERVPGVQSLLNETPKDARDIEDVVLFALRIAGAHV